jgi:hypothetical protein
MGTILGKDIQQALVHTVHSTSAFGTRAKNCMHLWKTPSQDCPHGEIKHFKLNMMVKSGLVFLLFFFEFRNSTRPFRVIC